MARLIYVFLALALGTLVAGFLVRDSSVPLLVSIGLSALVLLLILVGTSRRLRRANALEDEQVELASLEIVEIDETDVDAPEAAVVVETPKTRPARRRRAAAEDTQAMDAVDADEIAEPDVTEVVVEPKRSRRTAAAKARPPRRRAGTIVEPALDTDSFPEFAVDPDDAPAEETAAETVADMEPPLTIDAPARKPARARRAKAAPTEAGNRRGGRRVRCHRRDRAPSALAEGVGHPRAVALSHARLPLREGRDAPRGDRGDGAAARLRRVHRCKPGVA